MLVDEPLNLQAIISLLLVVGIMVYVIIGNWRNK